MSVSPARDLSTTLLADAGARVMSAGIKPLRAGTLPAYALGGSPAGPTKRGGGTVRRAIRCGGVDVRPGDWIMADDDGVVVYRDDEAEAVLAATLAKQQAEAARMAAIARGELRPAWLDDALARAPIDTGKSA